MSIISGGGDPLLTELNFYPANGLNSYTGYGRLELGIARELQRMGVRLNIAPDPGVPTLVTGYCEWLLAPHVAGTRRYILTQSESTAPTEKWVELMNRHAEAVFVTNPALVDYYEAAGVYRPVYCVGHGIDLHVPVDAPGWDGEGRFEWLTYTYGDYRKGAEKAMMAFKQLFGGDERHHLTIKARNADGWVKLFRWDSEPQMTLVAGQQSEYDWMHLLKRSHAFLFPSRAEGFGMPPREATLAGIPAAATRWLGMADVDEWGFGIDVKEMREARYDEYVANRRGALWAEPSLESLKAQMLTIYNDYTAARRKAQAGAWYLRRHNTWKRVAEEIVQHIGVRE